LKAETIEGGETIEDHLLESIRWPSTNRQHL
jgi:hypothetical protein